VTDEITIPAAEFAGTQGRVATFGELTGAEDGTRQAAAEKIYTITADGTGTGLTVQGTVSAAGTFTLATGTGAEAPVATAGVNYAADEAITIPASEFECEQAGESGPVATLGAITGGGATDPTRAVAAEKTYATTGGSAGSSGLTVSATVTAGT